MTIKVFPYGPIEKQRDGRYACRRPHDRKWLVLPLDFDPDSSEPMLVNGLLTVDAEYQSGLHPRQITNSFWSYRQNAMEVELAAIDSKSDIPLAIKSYFLKRDKALARMRREVESLERIVKIDASRRERINDSVRLFVWQRDMGKCVKCASTEKLEFDHIIPFSKGGSNTERNIQLLCERCNRSKGAEI